MSEAEPTIQSLFDLTGRVALITGASGYLGQAQARALAEAGARVIVSSRDPARAEKVAASLPPTAEASHIGIAIDHMDTESVNRGFASALEQAGRIDVLVNNGHEDTVADWTTVTAEEFTRQLANATGYFLLSRLLRDHAVARRGPASIILLGSIWGSAGSYPDMFEGVRSASPVAYHALKGGILQMVRHLAVHWARDRVRVNALSPGPFPPPQAPVELIRRADAKSPMQRMGLPHELKGAIVYLASDASSYVTGHNLVVDGGWCAW